MKWKTTVKFDNLHPSMILVIERWAEIINPFNVLITSANDSEHMNGSKHYQGKALDFRTKHIDDVSKREFERKMQIALGIQFYVAIENFGGENEHLHVQFNGE